MIATTKPLSQPSSALSEQDAQSADTAIRTSQHVAHATLDSLSDTVHQMRAQASPVLNRVAAKAEELARRSADAMRDRSADIKERAVRASDATVGYIKDEPVKAVLIAAAAGAALMALASLLGRRGRD